MSDIQKNDFDFAVKAIKNAIQISRYNAMRLVNREILSLYFHVGEYISLNSRTLYGEDAIRKISERLHSEMPGLRGFSETNIRRMRKFYEYYKKYFSANKPEVKDAIQIQPLSTAEFDQIQLNAFLSVGFTHHYEIFIKTTSVQETMFYVEKCAQEFWSVEKLKLNLRNDLYSKVGKFENNFARTISDDVMRKKALNAFRGEYIFNFVDVKDIDEVDEVDVENEFVRNIKDFIMALGSDFAFMGNQYRIIVEGVEYFIDLLFYNRRLQSLVAIELKVGDFKPEYAGKLNFYLSALDDLVKLPYENPSVGIILCRGRQQKTVEYAFRNTNTPMGVATYLTFNDLPENYRNVLPSEEQLMKLL